MDVKSLLLKLQKELENAEIGTARLDCLVLLEDVTSKNRAWLLAHPEHVIEKEQLRKLNIMIQQRVKHIPLAQVRGKTEFYGREFIINEHVLEPRPESETMIDLVINLVSSSKIATKSQFIDVGCGSGALGITAKLEYPESEVTLIDIDQKCLTIAKKNAEKHGVDIRILGGDLLEPLEASNNARVLLCNLPYVPDNYAINEAALNEPKIAIFGGPDGLDLYRRLFEQLKTIKTQYVLTESLPFQHQELEEIAKQLGYKQVEESDFIQVFLNP